MANAILPSFEGKIGRCAIAVMAANAVAVQAGKGDREEAAHVAWLRRRIDEVAEKIYGQRFSAKPKPRRPASRAG